MSSSDDHDLACRVQLGDRDAFAEIVRRHQRAVFAAAFRILADGPDAEDAAQDAFVRAYQSFDKFDASRPLAPWLVRITVNVCLNRLESRKSSAALDDEVAWARDPSPGPEAQSIARSRTERVRSELQGLPPRYRAVIELRHYLGLSYQEIAEALGQPLSAVKSDLFRARQLLSERLRDLA